MKEMARVAPCICIIMGSWALQRMPGYFSTMSGYCLLNLLPFPREAPGSPVSSSDSGSLAVHHGKTKVKIGLLKTRYSRQKVDGLLGVSPEKAPVRQSAVHWRRGRIQVLWGLKLK